MISKEQIKELLSEFIVNNNHNDFFLKGEEMQLNQSIYEIQYHLAEELERNKINTQLDSRIISDSILKSFRNRLAKCYNQKPIYYLNRNFRPDLELVDYINAFIEKNKESLSWQDIVITETGATRCKTNIRFSLDRLRKLGLVRKKNSQDKRTLLPTVLGQLVVHYFIWNYRNSKDATRPGESLSSDGYLYFSSQLQHLQTPTTLTNFLQHVKNNFKLNNQDLKKISNYANRFTEIVLKGLTIDKEKVKYNAEDIKGKDYDALLSELNNDYIFLRGNLGSNQDKS